ncbi:MAG: 16S rRNA (guanine(966)-N(2))-methyltransferase RsmD [Epulopiscium sp. Nuni2H_MBin003]|nr:MAG: 16S rRNA (guanine(966)-N(2))-methyltransferase RsmD [Epulopiscium sp. Nuni2H_MBin003]
MRVISGKYRGTKLFSPDGTATRPTTDRIKETLFNIINFDINECTFLDLFSGTGQIGIEAMSRGAKSVTFVEEDNNAIKILEKNIEKIRLQNACKTYKMNINKALPKISAEQQTYDIIFLDPPYYYTGIGDIVKYIIDNNILLQTGKIIIENATDADDIDDERLILIKQKLYKNTKINIYERM